MPYVRRKEHTRQHSTTQQTERPVACHMRRHTGIDENLFRLLLAFLFLLPSSLHVCLSFSLSLSFSAEVMILDTSVIVYKVINDVILYVVGNTQENELILQSVLQALDETISNLLKNQVSKRTLVENLDLLLLSIDEIIDDGLILETDSNLVVGRVCMVGGSDNKDVPLSEQSFTQALQTARDQLVKSFR